MGVCYSQNDHIIRQRRLTKKTVYKYSENKILNNTADDKNTKKYDDFKISCDNFYNINNNFNYSIIDNSSKNNQNKNNNDESINDLNLLNQPIESLTKNNPNHPNRVINININYSPDYDEQISKNEKYQKLIAYFKVNINQFPYNSLSQNQIISYEIEYTSSKLITPYKFIETKNYSLLFIKIYELCFLKCEPLLNNINDDKKKINLLFLRSVFILLSENNLDKTVSDVSNSLIELSYENNVNQLNININEFSQKIKSYCEICYQILFYFIIACSQFTEEQYYEYLSNQNVLIQDKYSNIDIDIFCLNMIFDNSKGNYELDEIISQWSDFICGKINNSKEFEGDNFQNTEINISLIKSKIIYMVNPYHLLQILSGIKLPKS